MRVPEVVRSAESLVARLGLCPRELRWGAATYVVTLLAALFGLRLLANGLAVNWPAAGVITGLILVTSGRNRTAVLLGALAALATGNLIAGRGLLPSLAFMAGNIGQGLAITLLVERFAGPRFALRGAGQVTLFFIAATLVVALVAWLEALALRESGHAPTTPTGDLWVSWFTSHLGGVLAVTPLLVLLVREQPHEETIATAVPGRARGMAGWTIRRRLALIVAAVVVPMNILAITAVTQLAQSSRNAQRNALLYTVHSLASAVEAHVARHIALGQVLANSPALHDDRLDAFAVEARRAFADTTHSWPVVVDANGQQLLNLKAPPGQPLPKRPVEGLAAQERAFATRSVTVSDGYDGPLSSQWLATIDFPIFKDGKPYRTLYITLTARGFLELLNARAIPSGWLTGIIDRNGRFLARIPDSDRLVGQFASEGWRSVMAQEGVFDFHSVEGDPILTATTRLSTGWAAGVAVRESQLMATAWSTVRWAGLLGGMLSFLSVLLAFAIARRITEPIQALGPKATALVSGQPVTLQSDLPELASVWAALGTAVEERKKVEARLAESEERLALALRAGGLGVHDVDPLTGRFTWDQTVRALWGVGPDEPITRATHGAGIHPDDLAAVEAAVARAYDPSGPGLYMAEFRVINRTTGETRWVYADGKVTFRNRTAVRLVGTVRDVTERKRREQQIDLLVREVNHRAKNVLTTVQAIAHQTIAADPADFLDRFTQRIRSLAASHDLLVESQWQGVELALLARAQLAHLTELIEQRVVLSGPALKLAAAPAQTIGMIIHELATNSLKHGAFSVPQGQVRLTWRIVGSGASRRLVMDWIERGGPPVTSPTRRGFGSTIIGDMARLSLGAEVSIEYGNAGLEWHLDCPAQSVVEM